MNDNTITNLFAMLKLVKRKKPGETSDPAGKVETEKKPTEVFKASQSKMFKPRQKVLSRNSSR